MAPLSPHTQLFSFLLLVAASCLAAAETLTIHDRITALSARTPPSHPPDVTPRDLDRILPPITNPRRPDSDRVESPQDSLELLDIVLVASVDGKFHALNRTNGRPLWSMASADSKAPQINAFEPLVRTQHPQFDYSQLDPDGEGDTDGQELYIIEPQSGDIYVLPTPKSSLQRLPFSMPQLVEMSPFSFSEESDSRVFVGKKETSLLVIELETGLVKRTISSECPWDPFEESELLKAARDGYDPDWDDDDFVARPRPTSKRTEVMIGRTDYHLSIFTRSQGSSKPIPVQNLSFSTYGPNNQDQFLQSVYRRTPDDIYVQPLPNGEIMSFKTRNVTVEDGHAQADSDYLWWHRPFPSPVVAVFDVLKVHNRQQPLVLLQPSPRLRDAFPEADLLDAARKDRLPGIYSAYVGLVESTDSLFAMTPEQFPMLVFRFDHDAYKTIDGSDSDEEDPHPDLDGDLDTISKKRKERLRCRGENKYKDKRCFTGIKPVQDSTLTRYSKLLDEAPRPPPAPSPSLPVSQPTPPLGEATVPPMSISMTPTDTSYNTSARARMAPEGSFASSTFVGMVLVTVLTLLASIAFVKKSHPAPKDKAAPEDYQPHVGGHSAVENDITISSVPRTPSSPGVGFEIASPSPRLPSSISDKELPPPPPETPPPHLPTPPPSEHPRSEVETEGEDGAILSPRKKPRRNRGGKNRGKGKQLAVEANEESATDRGDFMPDSPMSLPRTPVTPASAAPATPTLMPTSQPEAPRSSLQVSEEVLGYGSHGTVVYKGSLQGRAVAVKRLLHDFVTLASREVAILQDADDHPNVIRYYYQEAQSNFLFIALELCPASLADIIERPDAHRDISNVFNPKRALRQISLGLRHLHALKIVHRDIKPQNILISTGKKGALDGGHRMLISDFGLCKKLEVDQTSFAPTAYGAMAAGTVGWRAPEILRGEVKLDESAMGDADSQSSRGSTTVGSGGSAGTVIGGAGRTRLTKSVDIFALGCLFYYVLTNGSHPYGERFEREVNIMKDEKSLDGLMHFGEEGVEAVDLITSMLHPESSGRPDTSTCLLHPFFWDAGKRLTFLQDASDRYEVLPRDPMDGELLELERGAHDVVGSDWHSRMDKIFIENLGKYRKYNGRSIQDILRALRNKKHHYQDMPDNVKRHMGPLPEGFLAYFTRRFPALFLHVHRRVAASYMASEPMFRSYFELDDH